MIKYGLISESDGRTIEKTIDLITEVGFIGQDIYVTEVGIYDGQTARGIYDYVTAKTFGVMPLTPKYSFAEWRHYKCRYTAIDNNKDKDVLLPFPECNLIIGNSNEVYNQLENNSQHMILIDGNHSFPYVIADYYCYASKVKIGGYLCFHDTAPQAQGKDWQRMGDEKDQDMSISVVKALETIGLLPKPRRHPNRSAYWCMGWKLIFDEWDENDRCGGVSVFKKIR